MTTVDERAPDCDEILAGLDPFDRAILRYATHGDQRVHHPLPHRQHLVADGLLEWHADPAPGHYALTIKGWRLIPHLWQLEGTLRDAGHKVVAMYIRDGMLGERVLAAWDAL